MKPTYLFAVLLLAFVACKKENSGFNGNSQLIRIKKVIHLDSNKNASAEMSFNYNSSGRVTRYEGASFSYLPGMVIEHQSTSTVTYYLNGQGLAKKVVTKINGSGYYTVMDFTYDANGYCTAITSYAPNTSATVTTTQEFTIVDGNTALGRYSQAPGSVMSEYTCTYDMAHINTLDNEYFGMSFKGRRSKNALLSWGDTFMTPHYDSQGRIDTLTVYVPGSGTVVDRYTVYEYY